MYASARPPMVRSLPQCIRTDCYTRLTTFLIPTGLGTRKKESFDQDLTEADSHLLEMWQNEDAIEIAYWTGRREATKAFCSGKSKRIPPYIHPYRLKPSLRFVKGRGWPARLK